MTQHAARALDAGLEEFARKIMEMGRLDARQKIKSALDRWSDNPPGRHVLQWSFRQATVAA